MCPAVGWALGDGTEHEGDPAWDASEASTLYEILEREIVPEFYVRDEQGLPRAWLARVRESMARLTGVYSANRSVRQYLEDCYLPAAAAYHQRAANGGAAAVALMSRLQALNQGWPSLRFGDVCVDTRDRQHRFRAHVVLGTLPPEAIRVQLYADAVPGASRVLEDMVRAPAQSTAAMEVYVGCASADRPSGDYTVRIIPALADASIPFEETHILWQR